MESISISIRLVIGLILIGIALVGIIVASLTNLMTARGPQERRYLAVMTPLLGLALLLFLVLMYLVPSPWRYAVLFSYFILLPVSVYRVSWRRQVIRSIEQAQGDDGDDPS